MDERFKTEWCRLLDDAVSWLPRPIRDEIEHESDSSQWSDPVEASSFLKIILSIKEAELSMAMSLIERVYETSEYAGALFLLRARVHFLQGEYEDMMSCLKHAADLNEDPAQVEQTTAELAALLNRVTGQREGLESDVEMNAECLLEPTDEGRIQIDSTSDKGSYLTLAAIRKEIQTAGVVANLAEIQILGEYPSIVAIVDAAKNKADQVLNHEIRSAMSRNNHTFHPDTDVVFQLALAYCSPKDLIVEIGVWRGHTAAVLDFIDPSLAYIGIDPFELPGQSQDIAQLTTMLSPSKRFVSSYSSSAAVQLAHLRGKVSIVHIDGAHDRTNVFNDFMLYRDLLKHGGILIFDDYLDWQYSPDVKVIVDDLKYHGFFDNFIDLGVIPGRTNYILVRK